MKFQRFSQSTICILALLMIGTVLLPQPVSAAPSISIHPKAGAPGTKVIIDGTNFISYIGDKLSVFFNNTKLASVTTSVPLSGNFQISFEVPTSEPPGNIIIDIRNEAGSILADEIFTIPAPEVRLDTWGGTVSTTLVVSARGFYVGKPVNFDYYLGDEIINIGSQLAGETGECSIQFILPPGPRGKHSIVASNKEGQRAVAEFGIIPSVTITPQMTAVGDIVQISGVGFSADSDIIVDLYDRNVAIARSDDKGSFNTQFVVPVMKAGRYLIAVEDISHEVKWAEVLITARISLSKSMGEVGAKLTLLGTGFEVRESVIVSFNTQESYITRTDDIGAFTCTFIVPICAAGVHIITARDSTNVRQVVYAVESDAPAVPKPLSPKQYEVVTMPMTFDWEGVYDISQPLFYNLQIAHTSDFAYPILEKYGFTFSKYALEDTERLLPNRRGTYYYWRIRAIDGATNIGEWSAPVAFRVKPVEILPVWARYMLIVVQVVIIIIFTNCVWKAIKSSKGVA
jgi:hypothetical protein